MADSAKDYLSVYKRFFDDFAKTVDPNDQLPVRVAGYRLWDNEIVGETVDWTLQYLSQRNCPPSLLAPITRMVIDEIQQQCATQPLACGFRSEENYYLPLKLMKAVTNKVNEVCLRYCDNGRVTSLPPPTPGPLITSCAVKNSRRCMEDRHVILEDFHAFFDIKDTNPASYYAVFDGHAGTDAAVYSVSHLHQFLAESTFYPTDPEKAIRDAFFRTDNLFIEKSNKENLRSGTTAVCALLRPKEKKLYVAWLGDSQAVLVRNGVPTNLVYPHKPDRQDEMNRIHGMGGSVLFWGTWRVNGQLAVSRAIGDLLYKPYVTAEPDVKTIDLSDDEDFLILACDGLWDFATPEEVTRTVYDQLMRNPGDLEAVSQRLVQLSKQQGSTDNITVIVAFLRDPALLAQCAGARLQQQQQQLLQRMDLLVQPTGPPGGEGPGAMDSASTNPFESEMDSAAAAMKASAPALFEVAPPPYNNGHANGNHFDFLEHAVHATPNGKGEHEDNEDDDDDSGAEATEVGGGDALDPVHASLLPPAQPAAPHPLLQSNNPFGDSLTDELLQHQQTKEFDPEGEPARDTPTPPADEVPGVIGLVSDNVAESGEESEDEWNYYRVEHTGKSPQPSSESEQQTKKEICLKELESQGESAEDMESQLNPNAAEFIPSPTHTRPSMEELILSQGKTDESMEDVVVPSSSEFEKEVSTRPSEVDFENSFFNSTLSSVNTSGLVEEQEKRLEELSEFSKSQQEKFENPLDVDAVVPDQQESSVVLDDSTAFSTVAEFGDVTATSFMTNAVAGLEESSVTAEDSDAAVPPKEFPTEPEHETVVYENNIESPENRTFQDHVMSDFQKEPVHISFELQKEIAPQMESEPERVKVDSVDESPIESDVQITNDMQNADNPESVFTEDKSDIIVEKIEVFEGYLQEPVVSEILDNVNASDIKVIEKTEEIIPKVDEFDLLNDFCKPLPDMSQQFSDISTHFQSSVIESKLLDPGSPDEGFRENLPIQKESVNLLGHEMSTPEYEKLEKVVEASEALMDQINMSRKEAPVNIHLPEVTLAESTADEGAVLESAHPDKTELLVDACVELAVSTDPLDMFGGSDAAQVPFAVVDEQVCVEKSVSDLANPIQEKSFSDYFASESPVPSDNLDHLNVAIDSELGVQIGMIQTEGIESTRTPPPTPAVNLNTEPPQFISEPGNFEQVVEKLSAAEQSLVEGVSSFDPVGNDKAPEALCGLEPNEEKQIAAPLEGGDAVAAAVAGATVAAIATTAAVAATGAKEPKEKKETPVKKASPASAAPKKPLAAKPKDSSTDKPKTATKTASSRLTSATKTTKSPTSPVKSPIASKAPSRPMNSMLSKPPASKAPTRQPTKPPSSAPVPGSTPASSALTKAKPLTKPAVPKVGIARPKPVPPTTEKKPLTNGDIKTAPKRPEQLATKTSTNRPTSRPATAPVKTATKTLTKVSSTLTKASPPLNGPSRPRPASSVASKLVSKASTEKEIKDSANKQISTRTTTSTTSSSMRSATRLKSVTSPPRKIESKPLMNGKAPPKPSTMVKSTTSTKVPPKRPATATRLKSTKTSTLVEKSETVQGSATVVTTNEVKSEVVLDNSQV